MLGEHMAPVMEAPVNDREVAVRFPLMRTSEAIVEVAI